MSKQSKFAGGGKVGNTAPGNVPKGTREAATYSGADRAKSSSKENIITNRISLSGQNNAVIPDGSSSHNNINTFTRGIKSRGPYGGPSFRSFNNSVQDMQKSDTSSISKFSTPSGGTGAKGMGRVSKKLSGGDNNNPMTPNYQSTSKTNPKTPSSRKGGSGYMSK